MTQVQEVEQAIPQKKTEQAQIKKIKLDGWHSLDFMKKKKEQLGLEKVVFVLPNGKEKTL